MLTSSARKRALVIGAGPMGLETALRAHTRGFEVTVLEAGRVGEHIRQWGHIRLFSPLGMNVSAHAKKILGESLPPLDAIQTGAEYVATVLEPLAQSEVLKDRIIVDRKVVALARAGLGKMGLPNHPLRTERSFRVLAEDHAGSEHVYQADLVFDASGVFAHGNWSGSAGMPALGERKLDQRIIRHPIDVESEAARFAGKKILLLGHGHSAANTIVALARVQQRAPQTQIIWAVRSDRTKPVSEVADDPLHERAAVVDAANALALHPPENLRVLRRATLEELQTVEGSNIIKATLKVWKTSEAIEVDEIISLTGYRPNLDMLRETTVEFSSVTEGTRGLHKALSNITDCLAKIEVNPNDLQSGEPNLFIVGVKSYGRNSGFLLQSGNDQLDAIFAALM
ncbi:FAD-dependent oxidoreductase [candidate division KSB1 bacterium]|nr:FAD-dependent oxidoreductase [candidate division KSB1 bacterium]